jgi:hypothetical protein
MPSSNTEAQLRYQVCPIILTGGVASQIPGGMLPLLNILRGRIGGTPLNLPYDPDDLDNAFGAFNVLPGGTLVAQQIVKYPFANQSVAANATVRDPLTLSIIMDSPMRGFDAWAQKHQVMTNLKGTLDHHNNAGGTYTIMTPSYMYMEMIMTSLTDNSRGNSALPQNAWRFDFEKPLVALSDLSGAQNLLMSKITNGTPTDGTQTGTQVGTTSGQTSLLTNPQTGVGGQITSGIEYATHIASVINFPAVQNVANFIFRGVS